MKSGISGSTPLRLVLFLEATGALIYPFLYRGLARHLLVLDGSINYLGFALHCPLNKQCAIEKSRDYIKNSREIFLEMPRIKLGAAGCEARMLPLCYVAPGDKYF